MPQKAKTILPLVLIPVILLGSIYFAVVARELKVMNTMAPDGKGRTTEDYAAGRTATCVTIQFIKGGWAYPCTKNKQFIVALGHAAFGIAVLPITLLAAINAK